MLRNQAIIRQIRACSLLRVNTRHYSSGSGISLRDQLSKLKERENIPPSKYLELLRHDELMSGKEVEKVDEIIELAKNNPNVTRDDRVKLHNHVLQNFIQFDRTLSMIHQRELLGLQGEIETKSFVQIIKHNSGRNKASWEIMIEAFERNVDANEELLKAVLTKLIYGDASEIEDVYKVSERALLRCVFILKNLQNPPKDLLHEVLAKCNESKRYDLIQIIGLDSLDQIKGLRPNTEQLANLWCIWNPRTLSKNEIDANIEILRELLWRISMTSSFQKLDGSIKGDLKELKDQLPKLDAVIEIDTIVDQASIFQNLVGLLEQSGVLQNPAQIYAPLRETLLRAYGMNKLDYKHSLKLYHDFVALDKTNVDSLMSTMMKISLYIGVENKDPQQLSIAQALVPQPMTVNSLQALILGNSAFDIERSLDLFNSSIKYLSKEVNEQGISAAGLVTESLLISYLSKKDREFAYLIHDGAIMNDIVTSETGKNRMKAIFKRYGEIVGEERDDKINELLKDEVLKALKEL